MKKILMTNIAYGPIYADIFLNCHLRSLLDPQNIPSFKDRVEYMIFTDEETHKTIIEHHHYLILKDLCPNSKVVVFEWPNNTQNKFAARYEMLIWSLKFSIAEALKQDMYVSPMVADLVFGKEYLRNVLGKLDSGHEAIFCLPMRAAAESAIPLLQKVPWAMHGVDLLQMAFANMHPLWVACHWEGAQFTKLPFSLLWNSGKGLLVHSFSITPIVFQPTEQMKEVKQVIDVELPSFCKNIFWAKNATDIPVIGCEPLRCYYPPFENHRADASKVREWAKKNLHLSQFGSMTEELFFPNEELAEIPVKMRDQAGKVVEELLR